MSEQLEKETVNQEFFDRLSDKLEELFPKGQCKERSKALVLNAFANIIAKDLIDKATLTERERIKKVITNDLFTNRPGGDLIMELLDAIEEGKP